MHAGRRPGGKHGLPVRRKYRRRFFIDVNKPSPKTCCPTRQWSPSDENGHVKSHFAPDLPEGLATREAALAAGYIPVCDLLFDGGTDLLFDIAQSADADARERAKNFYTRIIKPLVATPSP